MSPADRELLELAAKAGGITILGWYGDGGEDGEWAEHEPRQGDKVGWNAMLDDGDAFRLQVAMQMPVMHTEGYAIAYAGRSVSAPQISERVGDDRAAATRRAIVRCAAEHARTMG